MIPTPKGPKPATFVFQVPSGSFISTKERTEFYAQDKQCVVTGNTTKVYLNETLILTVIDEEGSIAGETYGWGGWVEWAQDLYVSNLGDFRAYWHVPNSPPSPHSDVCNYLFNGIEPFWGGEIIQPVLEYFESCHCWKGAAWYADGNSFHSDPIDCYVGDYIQGWMLWAGSPPDWSVDFYDITRSTSTGLNTDAIDPSTVRAYVTYEGHNLVNDNDAPGDTTFERMVFKDTSGNSVNIDWSGHVDSSAPLTGLNVEIISQSEVILHTAN